MHDYNINKYKKFTNKYKEKIDYLSIDPIYKKLTAVDKRSVDGNLTEATYRISYINDHLKKVRDFLDSGNAKQAQQYLAYANLYKEKYRICLKEILTVFERY